MAIFAPALGTGSFPCMARDINHMTSFTSVLAVHHRPSLRGRFRLHSHLVTSSGSHVPAALRGPALLQTPLFCFIAIALPHRIGLAWYSLISAGDDDALFLAGSCWGSSAMCNYHYIYYSACCHQETFLTELCDTARQLRLWEQHIQYPPDHCVPSDLIQDAEHSELDPVRRRASLWRQRSRTVSAPPTCPHWPTGSLEEPFTAMMAAESVHSNAFPATHVGSASSKENPTPPARDEFLPRSVRSHADLVETLHPLHADRPRHDVYTRGRASLDALEIDLPMDDYAGFTMELIHKHGKVKDIVARFESCLRNRLAGTMPSDETPRIVELAETKDHMGSANRDPDTEPDGAAPMTPTALPRNLHLMPLPQRNATQASVEADAALHGVGTPTWLRRGWTLAFIELANSVGLEVKGSPMEASSLRKPASTPWLKSKAPMLKTAQRAMERELRKKTSQLELALGSSKSVRSPKDQAKDHKGGCFSKDTAKGADGTSAFTPSTAGRPRRTKSKSDMCPSAKAIASTSSSPSIKVTISPNRTPNAGGSAAFIGAPDSDKGSATPTSLSPMGSTYTTARQSPVSQSPDSSAQSFVTALEQCEGLMLSGLTPADDRQGSGNPRQYLLHVRGHSDSQAKALEGAKSSKNGVPRPASKAARTKSLPADDQAPLVLMSSSVPSTANSVSLLPRNSRKTITTPGIEASARSNGTVRRSDHVDAVRSEDGMSALDSKMHRAQQDLARQDALDDEQSRDDVSIPSSPARIKPPQPSVRTVDSSGVTPILSAVSPLACAAGGTTYGEPAPELVSLSHSPPENASAANCKLELFAALREPLNDNAGSHEYDTAKVTVEKPTLPPPTKHTFRESSTLVDGRKSTSFRSAESSSEDTALSSIAQEMFSESEVKAGAMLSAQSSPGTMEMGESPRSIAQPCHLVQRRGTKKLESSGLRATAPAFVPRQRPLLGQRPSLPLEWTRDMRRQWDWVAGAFPMFPSYSMPSEPPSKPGQAEDPSVLSTPSEADLEAGHVEKAGMDVPGNVTLTTASCRGNDSQDLRGTREPASTASTPTDAINEEYSSEEHTLPFQSQLDQVTERASQTRRARIRECQYRGQMFHAALSAPYQHPGHSSEAKRRLGRQKESESQRNPRAGLRRPHPPTNGLYTGPGSNTSYRTISAGMPLSSTVPFPLPMPPPLPRRELGGKGGSLSSEPHFHGSRQHAARPEFIDTGCGNMNIESALEWWGGRCHACVP